MEKSQIIRILTVAFFLINIKSIIAQMESVVARKSPYPIADIILKRWSSRAMSGEPITDDKLLPLFAAACWAPSAYNNQPWRFIYAKRDTPAWNTLFNLLVEFNQGWCKNAAALVVVVSKNTFDYNGSLSRTHSFDTGAAWQNLALQGTAQGLIVHGMEGFDYERAKKELSIPDGYTVEVMIAIGLPGDIKNLPKELQEKEKPSDRKSVSELISEGSFKFLS